MSVPTPLICLWAISIASVLLMGARAYRRPPVAVDLEPPGTAIDRAIDRRGTEILGVRLEAIDTFAELEQAVMEAELVEEIEAWLRSRETEEAS